MNAVWPRCALKSRLIPDLLFSSGHWLSVGCASDCKRASPLTLNLMRTLSNPAPVILVLVGLVTQAILARVARARKLTRLETADSNDEQSNRRARIWSNRFGAGPSKYVRDWRQWQ